MQQRYSADILIIGGGVVGCAIAYYLRKAGRDVMVVEKGEIGGQASGAAAGLLAPLGPLSGPGPFADLLLASFSQFPTVVPELAEASGLRIEYERTGALRVVRNPKRVAALRKRLAAWQALGLQMHWLSGEEARRQEPMLAPDVCAAVYAPEESQINASHLVRAFAQAAANLGARFANYTEVVGIEHGRASVTGVRTAQGEVIGCHHLVVAAGAWAATCGGWLGLALPVSPLRGQMLALARPEVAPRHIIFGEAAYIVPRGGQIIVGATKDEVGFDASVTAEGVAWLRGTASRLVPALEQCGVDVSWAGLRPRTPDTRPILGPAPGWQNVTLATGHNSVGIMLSIITGQTISELINGGGVPEVMRPFLVERFGPIVSWL